jgi:hypothetical protein
VAGVIGALTGTPAWLANLIPQKPAVTSLQPTVNASFQYSRPPPGPQTGLEFLIEMKLKDVRSGDPANDFVRRTAVRAAVNYVYTPCDEHPKRVLVEAVADYVHAYQKLRGCSYFCSPSSVKLASRTFTTSDLDRLVTDSIRSAYERGGLSTADFPAAMAADLAHVARLSEREPRVCAAPPPLPYVPRPR